MYMVGMGGRVLLFILEMSERVQARNKRWKKAVASRDVVKICSAAKIREGRTDSRERSEELEQGLEAHKYRRGEHFDALLLGTKGGRHTYGI